MDGPSEDLAERGVSDPSTVPPIEERRALAPARPAFLERVLVRVLAGWLGAAALLAGGIGVLYSVVAFFSAADPPSPFVGDGFICCSYPNTWQEVGFGAAAAMVVVGATVALFLLAAWLFGVLTAWRRQRLRSMVRWTVASAALVPVLMAMTIVPRLDEARVAPDCDTFVVDRRDLDRREIAIDGPDRAYELALLGVEHCRVLIGKTVAETKAMLGPATNTVREEGRRRDGFVDYGPLHATFKDDRIDTAEIAVWGEGFD